MAEFDRNKIQVPNLERPHLVLLGAGASYAAFPSGDRNGHTLPLMPNIVDVLKLHPVLEEAGVHYNGENFESLYSQLVVDQGKRDCVQQLEQRISDYFSDLALPNEPTLYDHLLLSLRSKDYIATFNWDPFLVQAAARNYPNGGGPRLLFLHGNTAIGYCMEHQRPSVGHRGNMCGQCGRDFLPSRLLYPVAQKDYTNDPLIKMFWDSMGRVLKHAFIFTVFGYGAPASDVEAVDLMKSAWGDPETRQFEQTEIIDVKPEDDLVNTWKPFILSHHYYTVNSFYNSIIARHPRRSCEAMWSQFMEAQFIDSNPIPAAASWDELRAFFNSLEADEQEANRNQKGESAGK